MTRHSEERRTGDTVAIDGSYQYDALTKGRPPQRFWHRAKLAEAKRLLDPGKGEKVLDVGCGSGILAAMLARSSGASVLGIDINESAIRFARSRFRLPNLEYRIGLVDDLDIPEGTIDKIAFLEVIEHITEAQGREVLRDFHRLLRPGGTVVITTPNYLSPWPLVEWGLDFFRLVPSLAGEQHVMAYNRWTLDRVARRAGFHVVTYRTINLLAPWTSLVSWRVAKGLHKLETRAPHPLGAILVFCLRKPGEEDSNGR